MNLNAWLVKLAWMLCLAQLCVACQPRGDVNEIAELVSAPSGEQENNMKNSTNSTQIPLEWRFYSQEDKHPDIQNMFRAAAQLVGQKDNFDSASEHYGTWIVLRYPAPAPNPNITDRGPEKPPAFLIDMAQKKQLSAVNWNDARPIFEDMINEMNQNPDKSQKCLRHMASIASMMAFGVEDYMEPDIMGLPGPHLDSSDNTTVLHFDVAPKGSSIVGLHCTLSFHSNSIEFKSEDEIMNL